MLEGKIEICKGICGVHASEFPHYRAIDAGSLVDSSGMSRGDQIIAVGALVDGVNMANHVSQPQRFRYGVLGEHTSSRMR